MENCSTAATPMSSSSKLDKDDGGQSVNITAYRGLIGSLLYLNVSRPDIQFSIGVCARFQANPKLSHFTTVKRILKYLKEIQNGAKLIERVTSGTCQFLGVRLISWFGKKQTSVATCTAKAEYLVVL
ncbi:uncharacterized mitochondrial protein AtMg00810-like [Impatiens glandulifera]|uniref:uncharacterized mitochondrial protein AtMg00810-like n=1 Tax=Impatiens glandulifera TaxID=253017 RepID=UPI001FB05510|nr:uncharacterized mitochondrial protein AtMg00810-like [Impatiens glandulifera]